MFGGFVIKLMELFDDLLRYGLYLGAIFQLVAIAAIIFVPPKSDDTADLDVDTRSNGKETSDVATEKEHLDNTSAATNKKNKKIRRRK